MGRRAEGWKLRERGPQRVFYVRFTPPEGPRVDECTGTSDRAEADKRAAEIYARVITGRAKPESKLYPRHALTTIVARWIARGLIGTHAENTRELYELHMTAHLIPYFERLDRVTTPKIANYTRERLGKVTRSTVIKERNTLRTFLRWCKEQEIIHALPEWPEMPPRAPGVRASTRKAEAVEVSPEQALEFLRELPERSKGKPGHYDPYPVRARFVFAWETGLRPITVSRLSVPEHWRPGATELTITNAIDKARFGRKLPLTPIAIAALEASAPKQGPIFGRRDYRPYVKAAAKAARMPDGFSPYDLRHGRATELCELTGNLNGVAYILGHKQLTTTNRYAKPTRRAADRVIAAVSCGANSGAEASEPVHAPLSASDAKSLFTAVVRRGGLEPPRCYPLAPQATKDRRKPRGSGGSTTAKDRKKPQVPGSFWGMLRNVLAVLHADGVRLVRRR